MSRKRLSQWQAMAVTVPGILIVAFAVIATLRSKPGFGRSTARPQPGMVVNYRYLPLSRLCGVGRLDAKVRLNNGEIVRAGFYQHGVVHDGTRVTVERRSSICIDAPYTILHVGPPDASPPQTIASNGR